jgi:hypothetical protein
MLLVKVIFSSVKFPRNHEPAELFWDFFRDISDVDQSGARTTKKKVGVEKEKVCPVRLANACLVGPSRPICQ